MIFGAGEFIGMIKSVSDPIQQRKSLEHVAQVFGMDAVLARARAITFPLLKFFCDQQINPALEPEEVPGQEYRADGWPCCAICGEDELYSLRTPATKETICGCYRCGSWIN